MLNECHIFARKRKIFPTYFVDQYLHCTHWLRWRIAKEKQNLQNFILTPAKFQINLYTSKAKNAPTVQLWTQWNMSNFISSKKLECVGVGMGVITWQDRCGWGWHLTFVECTVGLVLASYTDGDACILVQTVQGILLFTWQHLLKHNCGTHELDRRAQLHKDE